MIVPGDNLLYMALSVLASQTVEYFSEAGRAKQANGVFLTTYNAGQTIEDAQVQSIDRSKYLDMGLDFQKTYVTWFVPDVSFVTVQRAKSGDVIEWDGGRYQLESGITWNAQDGWGTAIACLIGPATGALNNG